MKLQITFKTPDALDRAVKDAAISEVLGYEVGERLPTQEEDELIEERVEAATKVITDNWCAFGEIIIVEFDTEAKTATVLRK